MSKSYYEVLGVDKKANKEEIKKAFYKLAHKHHPDKNAGDDKTFKEVNEAYQALSDDTKRAQYDRFGSTGGPSGGGGQQGNPFEGFDFSGFGGGYGGSQNVHFDMGDLGDVFGDMFGFGGGRGNARAAKRGSDLQMGVPITLEEVYSGVEKTLNYTRVAKCKTCTGSGVAAGSKSVECKKCNGKGNIKTEKRTIFGNFATNSICPDCEGAGKIPEKKCDDCGGKGVKNTKEEVKVKIPEGIDESANLIMRGYGEAVKGGETGDLYIVVQIAQHKTYARRGLNLYTNIKLKPSELLLGKDIEMNVLGNMVKLKIEELTHFQNDIVIKNKGLKSGARHGDLILKVEIEMPRNLNKEQKENIQKLKDLGL